MKKHYPSIQILRAVLFLFVLAFHCGVPYANFGWGGIEAFFVISVFFLVRKCWGSATLSVKQQVCHRIARLYPPYLAVLVVAALYALLMKAIPFDLVTHLLSAQNFQWMVTGYQSAMQPMTAHTWTLSIEIWDGLVWLLLLKCLSKNRFKNAMFGFLIVGILYRVVTIICGADVWVVSLCPIAHFDAFACGSLLAIAIKEEKVDGRISIPGFVGIAGITGCIAWMSNSNNIGFVGAYQLLSSSKNYLNNWFTGNIYLFISLLTTGLVGLLYIHDEKKLRKAGKVEQAFVRLGDNSYTLYLFHWPVFAVLKRLVHHRGAIVLLTFIVSVVAAMIFNWFYAILQKRHLGGKIS